MPPRPLRPKDEPGTSEAADVVQDQKSAKRRAVSSACIPCRKRKSKCDGQLPSCSTCTAVYRTECAYDADSDHRRKAALKRDIQSLQQRNDALDVIVASLRSLPEADAIALLHSIRVDTNFDALAASLATNMGPAHAFAPQTFESDFTQLSPSASTTSLPYNDARSVSIAAQTAGASNEAHSVGWFSTPQDPEFIDHLLNLYFCWVHPVYHFFSRDHFLRDMGRGRNQFCSALLVNAILAVACSYSDRVAERGGPHDASIAGDGYYAEAVRLLNATEKSSLTSVQAVAIMALRETSRGRDSNGYQLVGRSVRMALELGLHLSVALSGLQPAEVEVRKITFWAVFNLETLSAVTFGRLSQLPRTAADIDKPGGTDQTESQRWRPYEDTHLQGNPTVAQPARSMLFVNCFSTLLEIASDMVNTFYAPREQFTSRRLAATYELYKEWYESLPDVFRPENTTLPQVITLHMIYHSCVLHLFRPYIKLDLRGAHLLPRETCTYSANEISSLIGALKASYGLRRVVPTASEVLMAASTIHLLNLPSEPAASNFSQGLLDMQAMTSCHPGAGRFLEIIRALADKWNITLPDVAIGVFRTVQRSWPSPTLSSFFAPSLLGKESPEPGVGSSSSSSGHHTSPFPPPPTQQHAASLNQSNRMFNNTAPPFEASQMNMFWTPFPLQGIPMAASQDPGPPHISHQSLHPASQWTATVPMPQQHAANFPQRQHSDPGSLHGHMQVDDNGQWQWQ